MIREAALSSYGPYLDEHLLETAVAALIALEHGDDPGGPGRAATDQLVRTVGALYENGWQPADLVHIARKEQSGTGRPAGRGGGAGTGGAHVGGRPRARGLGGAVRRTSATEGSGSASATTEGLDVARWHREQGQHVWDGWRETLTLLGQWARLTPLSLLGPPPSAWGARRAPRPSGAAQSAAHADPKVLGRIRALLAKAESTDFPAEADALTAKAQDMMTRHAIDAALLDDAQHLSGGIASRRVHLESPYASTKVQLLSAVGEVNRVRLLWDEQHAIATIVGAPVDLDLVEMLFTSLLVQAVRAMTHEGGPGASSQPNSTRDNGSRRSAGFRRAFLLAYAIRIGERLAEAGAHATADAEAVHGAALVPVLARRSAEVDAEFSRLFPETRSVRRRSVDARGWHAGRAAADQAVIAAGQVDGDRAAG